jgi:hypothetical protein
VPDYWQIGIRGETFGSAVSGLTIGPSGIQGLGLPAARFADQEDGDEDGDVGGADVLPKRVLTIPLNLDADGPGPTMALLQQVKRAWRPVRVSGSEVALDLTLPGLPGLDETLRFYGRPRGASDDLSDLKAGHAELLLTFEALDPFGYGAEETELLAAGANVFESAGDADSRRWSLTLTRTGATSSIEVAEYDEPALALEAGSSTLELDGRSRTIVEGAEVVYPVLPGSGWPKIVEGTNTLTLTGASGTLIYRPAFH